MALSVHFAVDRHCWRSPVDFLHRWVLRDPADQPTLLWAFAVGLATSLDFGRGHFFPHLIRDFVIEDRPPISTGSRGRLGFLPRVLRGPTQPTKITRQSAIAWRMCCANVAGARFGGREGGGGKAKGLVGAWEGFLGSARKGGGARGMVEGGPGMRAGGRAMGD